MTIAIYQGIAGITTESTMTTVMIKWRSPGFENGRPIIVEIYYSYFSNEVWYAKTLLRGETSWTIRDLPHSTKIDINIRAISNTANGVMTSSVQSTKGHVTFKRLMHINDNNWLWII